MRASRLGLVSMALLVAACARSGGTVRAPEMPAFRTLGVGSPADPTVRPARVLPETVDETQGYGTESSGGIRAITAGLRVVTSPHGAILAADDRLPQPPKSTTALPERLGGGFLFVLGTTVWRADRWLGPARPIFTSAQDVTEVVPGLDRVYVRAQNTLFAIDGKGGTPLDLGPWPASPYVASYAAVDGWRAAAVTDLRGVVATFDAGATWRVLDLPMEPRQVLVSGDGIAVGGVENARCDAAWFEVRADGSIARLGGPPREAKGKSMPCGGARAYFPGGFPSSAYPFPYPPPVPAPPASAGAGAAATADRRPAEVSRDDAQTAGARIFGKRPLAAALEDGWPLTDGTAVVARNGALGRVRLADGALTELAQGAFPLGPSRCHAVSLTRPSATGAFGFVCGEPRGATAIYAYDPMRGRVSEIKRFDRPRTVTSSGNGALAVRGGCAEDADLTPPASSVPTVEALKDEKKGTGTEKKERDRDEKDDKDKAPEALRPEKPDKPAAAEVHPYCVLGHDNTWREVHVRSDSPGERVVVLADGRIAVLSPPRDPSAPARLTILDKGNAATLPVVFPKVPADVARVLRLGVWLEGFEERRPGVLGGWIEAGGAMLGLEIALDGKATPGQFIRDAGMPFVSGRYGLGWTSSRRAYETTDGGMTWTSAEVPEPLVPVNKVERRACGPIGCIAAGWLRVGWGEAKKVPVSSPPPPVYRSYATQSAPSLTLACEPLAPAAPPLPVPKVRPTAAAPTLSSPFRRPYGGPPVLSPTYSVQGATELHAFYTQPAVTLRDGERGFFDFEVQELPEKYPRLGSLARVYAWGPKTGELDTLGRWQVKWLSPFSGWPEVKASVPVLPPQLVLDYTKAGPYGSAYSYASYSAAWQLAIGDDPAHALLVGVRASRTETVLVELEADRAPVEIRRVDGEPFTGIDGLVRAAGRWIVATPPVPGTTPPMTTIWQVDGSVARELTRVPRAGIGEGGRSATTRLARRSDGRAVGLVVDGQPTAERAVAVRWVLPVDLETGQLGEPESIGYADLAGVTLDACTDDVVGWTMDAALSGTTVRLRLPQGTGSMHSVYARVRLTGARACVERVAGMYDGQTVERTAQLVRPGAPVRSAPSPRPGELIATAVSSQNRYSLRCTVAK